MNKYLNAKPIGNYLSRITKFAFEKFGFPAAALLSDWPAIVGTEIASYTRPERLKWPQAQQDHNSIQPSSRASSTQNQGATLLLRVEGPRALEIQFKAPQIIERINTYFGYRAVTQIRILQAPVKRETKAPHHANQNKPARDGRELSGIENNALKAALSRLGQNIKNR